MKHDFSNYKFRCHTLPKLMTKPRKKTEVLSETTKTFLREVFIEEVYGRRKYDSANKYTRKGVIVETDSIELLEKYTGETYFKNNTELENDYIKGTPDTIVGNAKVIDIKSSWDMWTFAAADQASALKTYGWQVKGYRWLTDTNMGQLAFALANTPEDIIQGELYKMSFSMPELSTDEALTNEVRKNYIFDDLDITERVKVYEVPSDNFEAEIVELQNIIMAARDYLNHMTL